MKIGIRVPSLRKRISAHLSVKRAISNKIRMPKGMGWMSHPKKFFYNRFYRMFTR